EPGAGLGEIKAPPGADPGAELEVLVGQQIALVIEVRQTVDVRALEGARHLLGELIALDEAGRRLPGRNDREAVDVERQTAAPQAEDARRRTRHAILRGARASEDLIVRDAEVGRIGTHGARVR